MLAGDWDSFDFSYVLDMPALVPHFVALEAYKAAALTPVLPPQWLESQAQPPHTEGEHAGDNQFALTSRPARGSSLALEWIRQRFVPGCAPLSVPDILAIHGLIAAQSMVEAGCIGALRTTPVRVGRPSVGGFHLGAPAERLSLLLDQYVLFIDREPLRVLAPVVHALLAHFFFATIHPFLDGNGRTSRLIAAAILSRRGYYLHGSHALIRYFYSREVLYHTILHRSWRRCPFEVTPFIAFGIEGVVTELRSIDTFLQMKVNRTVDHGSDKSVFRRRPAAR